MGGQLGRLSQRPSRHFDLGPFRAIGELQRDGPFRFGTVTPPTFGENATTFLMEAGLAMNPNIEDPERRELAWKLLKKLGTERGQYYMSRNFWAMPSIPAVVTRSA